MKLRIHHETSYAYSRRVRFGPHRLVIRPREGIDTLEDRCLELIADTLGATNLLVPHDRYDVIARLHKLGHIHEQEHEDAGVRIKGRFPATQTAFFAPFVVK